MWRRRLLLCVLLLFCFLSLAPSQELSSLTETTASAEESSPSFSEAVRRLYALSLAAGKREEGAAILDLLAESETRHETRYVSLKTTAKLADEKLTEMQAKLAISQTSSVVGWTTASALAIVLALSLALGR